MTRREFFALFGGVSPHPTAPVVVTAEVEARAAAFREALAAPREREAGRAQVAVFTPVLCLLRFGTDCATCAEACSAPGALVARDRGVHIDTSRCTGCGRCADRCPAPTPALVMRSVTR